MAHQNQHQRLPKAASTTFYAVIGWGGTSNVSLHRAKSKFHCGIARSCRGQVFCLWQEVKSLMLTPPSDIFFFPKAFKICVAYKICRGNNGAPRPYPKLEDRALNCAGIWNRPTGQEYISIESAFCSEIVGIFLTQFIHYIYSYFIVKFYC